MNTGHFYFLSEDYFRDFPDRYIMNNKETINGVAHDRPCFYAFQESENGIYWTIPFSSRVNKYREEERKKIKRYKYCNTILFGEILGHEKAFLIQNMCPVINSYIKNEYIDSSSKASVKINYNLEKKLIKTAKDILFKVRCGNKYLVFPDILKIEKELLEVLKFESEIAKAQQEVAPTKENAQLDNMNLFE